MINHKLPVILFLLMMTFSLVQSQGPEATPEATVEAALPEATMKVIAVTPEATAPLDEVVVAFPTPNMIVVDGNTPNTPIIIQQPADNSSTSNIAIIGFVIAILAMMAKDYFRERNLGAALSHGTELVIGNETLSETIENNLNRLPETIRSEIMTLLDVFDPISKTGMGDLRGKTVEWARNMLDGDPKTGAVVDRPPLVPPPLPDSDKGIG